MIAVARRVQLPEMVRYRLFLATLRAAQYAARPTTSWWAETEFPVVGGQRSGTPTLSSLLAEHP
ncbi:MAG: hypothetical protein ACR2JF_13510, partial [Iamia sp.]